MASTAQAVNAEASSLWSKFVGTVTGQRQKDEYGERMENGHVIAADVPGEGKRDTASAQFAHYSVEVCFWICFI
jgi:Ca2+-transporting ATPase